MVPLQGWMSYGGLDANGTFVEADDVSRTEWNIPAEQIISISLWTHIEGPANMAISHGSVFDSRTKGRPLVAWKLLETRTAPTRVPPHDVWIDLETIVRYACNATSGLGITSQLDISKGSVVGRCNGASMVACAPLVVVNGQIIVRLPHHRKAAA